jgi:hypothetical protein
MTNIEAVTAPMVHVEHVSSEYFITTVRSYEQKYRMDWLTFFTEHRDCKEETNEDFSDWMFLCKAYFADLVAANGPPPLEKCSQKPERDSGFCSLRGSIPAFARQSTTLRISNQPSPRQLRLRNCRSSNRSTQG